MNEKFKYLGRPLSRKEQKLIIGGDDEIGTIDDGGGNSCCAHSSSCGGAEVWCCGFDAGGAQAMATILAIRCGEGHWCCSHCQGASDSNCG